MMFSHLFNFKNKKMNVERISKEKLRMPAMSDQPVENESGENQMSNNQLRELLRQHVGIL